MFWLVLEVTGKSLKSLSNEKAERGYDEWHRKIWDNIYKGYLAGEPAWASLNDGLHPEFLSFMERTTFPVKYALDIGCGTGKYLKYLQQQAFHTVGLDSSESAISMARELLKPQGDLITADMYEYKYPVIPSVLFFLGRHFIMGPNGMF